MRTRVYDSGEEQSQALERDVDRHEGNGANQGPNVTRPEDEFPGGGLNFTVSLDDGISVHTGDDEFALLFAEYAGGERVTGNHEEQDDSNTEGDDALDEEDLSP